MGNGLLWLLQVYSDDHYDHSHYIKYPLHLRPDTYGKGDQTPVSSPPDRTPNTRFEFDRPDHNRAGFPLKYIRSSYEDLNGQGLMNAACRYRLAWIDCRDVGYPTGACDEQFGPKKGQVQRQAPLTNPEMPLPETPKKADTDPGRRILRKGQ